MFSSIRDDAVIVIIDDVATNILLLESCLRAFNLQHIQTFSNSAAGLQWCQDNDWDLLLLDIDMPAPNGFDILDALQGRNRTASSIIIVTALDDPHSRRIGLEKGANDYICKPIDMPEVLLRVRGCLMQAQSSRLLQIAKHELELKMEQRTVQLQESYRAMLRSLSRAASYRDNDTGDHIDRIGQSAALLAKKIGMPANWCNLIRQAAPMHDVGKIGVPDSILQKSGPLTCEERTHMQTHPRIGYEILHDPHGSGLTDMAAEISLGHHEKWDGTGYPSGLKGEDIPLSARIVALCDVYDALRMVRPYKSAWDIETATTYIKEHAGSHFDPVLSDAFCEIISEVEKLRFVQSKDIDER
ncbi:response regulator [Pseudomonas sp. LJDD11]|uniref:response regulator n=1 Tax=unclassified Pseudomonas TaxID=196821 RepID=UPI002096D8B9|nr:MULTISPECIES: HD domain-containing phosphohydrolase [unclassified Pseudomonas]MCO8165617.1 response regulator [Pseudomonas sp. 21LCFQ010]MCQ9423680.1 response regulator [Pseudomonas sp. LJDD11]